MKNCILIKKNYFFFKKDISLKWLHLVNELDCYKGVNVKLSRYFNAMASFCERSWLLQGQGKQETITKCNTSLMLS